MIELAHGAPFLDVPEPKLAISRAGDECLRALLEEDELPHRPLVYIELLDMWSRLRGGEGEGQRKVRVRASAR